MFLIQSSTLIRRHSGQHGNQKFVNLGHEQSVSIANRLGEQTAPSISITGYEPVSADDTVFPNNKMLQHPVLIPDVHIPLEHL